MSSSDDGLIYVAYGPTNDVYDALMHATDAIARVINDLENLVGPLASIWLGSSADAWQFQQNQWNDLISDMRRSLIGSAATLQEMTTNYGTTDNNLALQWQDIALG